MYTVLIVEDEILVSAGLRSMIRWSDIGMAIVGEARNGKQGLEMYYQLKRDLILTDIKMPVMDGLEMLEHIRTEDKDVKILILTCYEEFELIRQAFKLGVSDYILKLKMLPEELEHVFRKVREELDQDKTGNHSRNEAAAEQIASNNDRNIEIRDYIMKNTGSYKEFKEAIHSLHLKEEGLHVCMMKLISEGQEDFIDSVNPASTILNIALNLIQTQFSKQQKTAILMEADTNHILLVSHFTDIKDPYERELRLRVMASKINATLQKYLNRKLAFGISSYADSYQELNRLYTEASEMLSDAVFLEEECSLYGINDNQQKYRNILMDFIGRVKDADCLSDIFKSKLYKDITFLCSLNTLNAAEVKERFVHWIHGITFAGDMIRGEMIYPVLGIVMKIRSTDSLYEIIRIFERYLTTVQQNGVNADAVSNEVAEVISYIQGHYLEADISLSEAACRVDMNKDYLSAMFKREVGIGFSEYVNSKRIKRAQELLETTRLKSYQIAQEIGFQDESYFSRVFKKVAGLRPNEYRKQVLSAKHDMEKPEI